MLDRSKSSARRAADVESSVGVGRVSAVSIPLERATSLVVGVEAAGQHRVEQREHQRPVVAPRPGRLTVRARRPEDHARGGSGWPELIRHADCVANEMPPDGAGQSLGELTAWGGAVESRPEERGRGMTAPTPVLRYKPIGRVIRITHRNQATPK